MVACRGASVPMKRAFLLLTAATALASARAAACETGFEVGSAFARDALALDGRRPYANSVYAPADIHVVGAGTSTGAELGLSTKLCGLRLGAVADIGFLEGVRVDYDRSFSRDLSFALGEKSAAIAFGGFLGYERSLGPTRSPVTFVPHVDVMLRADSVDLVIDSRSRELGDLGELNRTYGAFGGGLRFGARVSLYKVVGLDVTGVVSPFGLERAGVRIGITVGAAAPVTTDGPRVAR